MDFRITGLSPGFFTPLFGLSGHALAESGVRRVVADRTPGFPDRITLSDAAPGDSLLLLNYEHQPAPTPFRACHAIYVREGARSAFDAVNEVPDMFRGRMLSVRSFGSDGMMRDAGLVAGTELEALLHALLSDAEAEYLHVHFAARGCYAARVARA